MARQRTGVYTHIIALLGYFALALAVTYPAILHFTTQVPGDLLADRDQNLWNLWWVKEALGRGVNPFHTDMLYYPYGADLYYHTLALPLGLIGLLPQITLGLPAAYNSVLIVGFTLSGYGAFRLGCWVLGVGVWGDAPLQSDDISARARYIVPLQLAAFLGGIVFAFTPYTLDALKGQPEVLSLQWMPLYAEMWLRSQGAGIRDRGSGIGGQGSGVRRGWWMYPVLAGVFLALTAYCSLYYAVYMLLFTVAHIVYKLLVAWRARARYIVPSPSGTLAQIVRDIARNGAVVAVVTAVLTLPLLAGLIADRNNPRLAVVADPAHRLAHSADLLSFFAPPHDHLIFGTWQDRPGVNEPPLHDYVSLGYIALALAVLGAVVGWRRSGSGAKFWVGLGLLVLALALGPQLQVGRELTGIPLPFGILDKLPGMDAIAKPERFTVLARLCMGVLASMGAVWVFVKLASVQGGDVGAGPRACPGGITESVLEQGRHGGLPLHPLLEHFRTAFVFTLALALLLIELPIHPRYIEPISISEGFNVLAAQPPGGLMELPFATQQVDVTGQRMLYQTAHDKPIMGGYLSRRYDSPIIDSCSPFWGFISPLDVPAQGDDVFSPKLAERPLDVLNYYNISYIALYNKYGGPDAAPIDPGQKAAFEGIVARVSAPPGPSQPIYSDSYVSLYKVYRASGDLGVASFNLGQGWYNMEASGGKPFRWLKEGKASLCTFSPHKVTAPLTMEGTAFSHDHDISISIGGQQIYGGKLPAGVFTTIKTAPIQWQPGVTEVDIEAKEPGVAPQSLDPQVKDDRVLTVGLRAIRLDYEAQK